MLAVADTFQKCLSTLYLFLRLRSSRKEAVRPFRRPFWETWGKIPNLFVSVSSSKTVIISSKGDDISKVLSAVL